MKIIRSILERYQHFVSSPYLKEIEGHWQQAYVSPSSVFLLGAMIFWLVFSSLWWSFGRLHELSQLSDLQKQIQNMPSVAREPLQLGAKRLMGTPPPQAAMAEHVVIQAILFDNNPQQREVLLLNERGQVQSYKLGDKLPGGSEIMDIEPQSIVIERYGVKQEFRMNQYPANFISNQPLQQTNSILQ